MISIPQVCYQYFRFYLVIDIFSLVEHRRKLCQQEFGTFAGKNSAFFKSIRFWLWVKSNNLVGKVILEGIIVLLEFVGFSNKNGDTGIQKMYAMLRL